MAHVFFHFRVMVIRKDFLQGCLAISVHDEVAVHKNVSASKGFRNQVNGDSTRT